MKGMNNNSNSSQAPADNLIACPSCGAKISANAKFCPECGKALGSKFCPECGAKISGNAKFCPECGKKL